MAEINIPNPAESSLTPNVPTANNAVGTHGAEVNGTVTAVVSEEIPDLLHTPFDRSVTIQGYPDTVFNQMFRKMGYRSVKALAFDKFTVDQRSSADTLAESQDVSVNTIAVSGAGKQTVSASLKVANWEKFHKGDQISFKNVWGYDNNGNTHVGLFLNAYVNATAAPVSPATVGTITVQITNACANTVSGSQPTIRIPATCEVLILGAALSEDAASCGTIASLPSPSQQYMQKFMTMASVTNVWEEIEKNCDWTVADIKEGVTREFLLETEKTYLFGHKAYFKDTVTQKMIRTTGGLIEQMLEEGVEAIEIWRDDLTDESNIQTMKEVFVGNRGSERRYMLTGMDYAAALFSLKSMQKRVNTGTKYEYTYEWDMWKLFNYTIQNKPYALFDMLGLGNWAFIFDKANIERCVLRPMDEDQLDLNKLMIEDSKVMRCCEISCMVLKYAKCHRLIIMHDGDEATNGDGSLDKIRLAA